MRKPVRRFAMLAAASLAALAVSGAALAADAAAVPPAAAPAAAAEAPRSADDWGTFGIQTWNMDTSVRPGADFNRFVNGRWIDRLEIPADKSRYGSFTELDDLSANRIRTILDELVAANPAPGSAPESAEARIVAAYSAFMNADAIEAAGLAPAQPHLADVFAARTTDDLFALFARPGFSSPLGATVFADQKQSDTNALYVYQGGLGLPDRDYYLEDTERYRDIRAKYLDLLTFMLGKAGYQDARAAATAVMDLETRMARENWDRTLGRNRDLTYNRLTFAELEALAPGLPVRRFLADLGAGAPDSVIAVEMPPTAEERAAAGIAPDDGKLGGGLPATLRLVSEVPVGTWQAWLAAHFLIDNAAYLPREIDDARFAFYGTVLNGQPQQRARWKRGIGVVEGQVGDLLGRIYADRHFPAANRAAMTDLVGNLRRAMAANLAELSWMGPETRTEAEAKLNAFVAKIGAPDTYKAYEGLELSASTPLANALAAARWQMRDQFSRLGKPVDRAEWLMPPQQVNAYYNPVFNEIVFPAAILQPPFFNVSADPAVNYGAIGAVIGHEMGHGFDDQGAKSDGEGNLRDWWTPADKANFERLTSRLGDQYNGFCPFDDGKTCVNGAFTMGENIGDLGGLSLAYRAYRMSLNGQEAPVIDGYTGDQRFFMAWAQVWRNKTREADARQRLVTDPHSPPEYRINGIVRNFDEWYRAFDIQPGDALYLPPEKRLRIW